MGVWQQLKNAPEPQVVIQGLYSIVTGLRTDLYNQVSQTVLNVASATYESFKSQISNKITHLPEQTISSLYYDENYGFKT